MTTTLPVPPLSATVAYPGNPAPDFDFTVLRPDAAGPAANAHFEEMTFPSLRPLLLGQDPDATPVAVGAQLDGKPVGLALGRLRTGSPPMPRLMSLYVVPDQRNRGLGAALLGRFEREMAAHGCAEVDTVFMTPRPGAAEFAAVLARRGWIKPELRMCVLRTTAESIRRAPWYSWPLTAGLALVPWREITDAERADLRTWQEAERWIPKDLVPFDSEEGADLHVSLAVRYHGRIVGWMISHKIDATTVRATTCWLHPDLPPRVHATAFVNLIKLTTERAIEPECGAVTCSWTVPVMFPRYLATSDKWIAPYCTYRGETLASCKSLRTNGNAQPTGAAATPVEAQA